MTSPARTSLAWVLLWVMRRRHPEGVLNRLIAIQPAVRRLAAGVLIGDASVLLSSGWVA